VEEKQKFTGSLPEVYCCSDLRKQTHQEILPERLGGHVSSGERPTEYVYIN